VRDIARHTPRPWPELRLTEIEPPAAVVAVLKHFDALYDNGGAWVVGFQADTGAFDDVVADRQPGAPVGTGLRVDHRSFLEDLLASDEVHNGAPELFRSRKWMRTAEFTHTSGFALEGQIAEALFNGGAYVPYEGSPADAKAEAERLVGALMEDRFPDVRAYHNFGDSPLPWDQTWVILDYVRRRIWCLRLDDSD
jgi:hypothetical protein